MNAAALPAPDSILLVATRQIGDVLLTTPLLRSLRRAYPAAAIDVLVYTDKGGMLAGNPDCREVIETDEHPDFKGYLRLLRRVLRRYDLAVTVQANDRGHALAWLAGRRRVGIVPDRTRRSAWKRGSCARWTVLDNVYTHTVVQNLRLTDALGIPRCHEVVPPSPRALASDMIPSVPYAVVHAFPMWRYKRWVREGWVALLRHLRERDLRVVLTGGPAAEEREFCSGLAAEFGSDVTNLAGALDFGSISALLRGAACFIGPDTAVTHQAAACGIPVVAIYGPTNPVKWGPWPVACTQDPSPWQMRQHPWQQSGNVILVQGIAECLPCREEGCERHKQSYSRCLDDLPAQVVCDAVDTALGHVGARGASHPIEFLRSPRQWPDSR